MWTYLAFQGKEVSLALAQPTIAFALNLQD